MAPEKLELAAACEVSKKKLAYQWDLGLSNHVAATGSTATESTTEGMVTCSASYGGVASAEESKKRKTKPEVDSCGEGLEGQYIL